MNDLDRKRIDEKRHHGCTNAYHGEFIKQLEADLVEARRQLSEKTDECATYFQFQQQNTALVKALEFVITDWVLPYQQDECRKDVAEIAKVLP